MGQQEKNKVEFGLENVYFARATTDLLSGATTYEKPIRWPGAVELSLEASGDLIKFKADNIDYYISGNNQGYDGKLTTALVPEEFVTKILGEVVEGGVQTEYSNAETSPFALMFQFEGDKKQLDMFCIIVQQVVLVSVRQQLIKVIQIQQSFHFQQPSSV